MSNIVDGVLEDFADNKIPAMVAGRVETIIEMEIKTTFEDSFTDKQGKEVPYFQALVPIKHGLKQVSITKELFEKATKPGGFGRPVFLIPQKSRPPDLQIKTTTL